MLPDGTLVFEERAEPFRLCPLVVDLSPDVVGGYDTLGVFQRADLVAEPVDAFGDVRRPVLFEQAGVVVGVETCSASGLWVRVAHGARTSPVSVLISAQYPQTGHSATRHAGGKAASNPSSGLTPSLWCSQIAIVRLCWVIPNRSYRAGCDKISVGG